MLLRINGYLFWPSVLVAMVSVLFGAWTLALVACLVVATAWIIGRTFGPHFTIVSGPVDPYDDGDMTGVREPRRPPPAGSLSAAEIEQGSPGT
jgi:hypothetical protein